MNGRDRSRVTPLLVAVLLGATTTVSGARRPPVANGGPPGAHLTSLAIAESQPLTLAVTLFEGGIHRTDDGGHTWRDISPPGQPACTAAFDPDDADVLYADCNDHLLKSSNGGGTWMPLRTRGRGSLPVGITLRPGQRLWMAVGRTLLTSRDAGRSWTARAVPLPEDETIDAVAIADDASSLYVASRSGLHKSDDDGRTFVPLTTFPAGVDPSAVV